MKYCEKIRLDLAYNQAVERVREALAGQGFGVLTEIDVRATLRDKLGEDMEDYLILGACNPELAHPALGVDRSLGLLLPCNVVVRSVDDGTLVEFLDPRVMVAVPERAELAPVAEDAGGRLAAARAALADLSG
jgi:uncharacterized protein (DUF302 family)